MPREPQPVVRRDEIKRIPKEVSGLEYDVIAKPSPDGKGWDVIRPLDEHVFREAHKAIQAASTEIRREVQKQEDQYPQGAEVQLPPKHPTGDIFLRYKGHPTTRLQEWHDQLPDDHPEKGTLAKLIKRRERIHRDKSFTQEITKQIGYNPNKKQPGQGTGWGAGRWQHD